MGMRESADGPRRAVGAGRLPSLVKILLARLERAHLLQRVQLRHSSSTARCQDRLGSAAATVRPQSRRAKPSDAMQRCNDRTFASRSRCALHVSSFSLSSAASFARTASASCISRTLAAAAASSRFAPGLVTTFGFACIAADRPLQQR
jgi:hypothetical protein